MRWAAWAHRNLPAKNTLTATDAKIIEERFKARLSTIGDARTTDGTSDGPAPGGTSDGLAPDGPNAVPARSVVSASGTNAVTSQKASKLPAQCVLWAKRFAWVIRTTGSSCCGNRASCAAVCYRIRITSPLHNRVHLDAE
jgi:hypothetical protein